MSARAWRVAVALAGAACGLVALAALLGGDLREPAADAIPEVVVGWSFIAAGIVATARRPGSRAGLLMVAIGFAWLVRELQYVESGLAHTLGMFVEGFQWLLLAHLLATFPTGRPQDRLERATLVAIYVFAVPNAFGTLPYEESRPPDCPDCPANVLSIAPDAGVADAVHTGMAAGTVLIAALVLVCFVRRWRRATPSGRRAFTPVLAGTLIVFAVAFAGAISTGPLEELPDWVTQLAFLSLAAGLLVGLLRAWLDRQALGDLVLRLGQASTPARLRALLARALHDPTVELLYWDDERATYVDEAGRERSPDAVAAGRAVTRLGPAERPVGALLHDPLLLDDPVLVHAVGEAARLAVENGRLQSEVRAQVRELRASRQRIAEAAISERRKVERDLHDGAQQRLISLSLALAMAEERAAETSDADLTELLGQVRHEAASALAELRELARGIHPALLTEAGLAPALASLAERAAVPTRVVTAPERRLPGPVEATAYFVVSESLANLAKHAHASAATIAADVRDGEIRIEVADDGVGGADGALGSGLRGLEDRVGALGGSLDVCSPHGGGTRITARIPCA